MHENDEFNCNNSNRNTNYTSNFNSNYRSDDRSSYTDNMSSAKRVIDVLKDDTNNCSTESEVRFKNEYDTLKDRLDKVKSHFSNYNLNRHIEVENWKRAILVDWTQEVNAEYNQQRRTINLAISIIDLYLMKFYNIMEKELQLLAVASLYIASKYEEVYIHRIEEFAKTTDDAYTCDEILLMERKIMMSLNWDLNLATPCDFLNLIMSEWDNFVIAYHPYFPQFRQRTQHGASIQYTESFRLLDLSRLFIEHYQYDPRVLSITIIYVVLWKSLVHRLDTQEFNKMFNEFLACDVDYCFTGLKFDTDMLPCIKFVHYLLKCNSTPVKGRGDKECVSGFKKLYNPKEQIKYYLMNEMQWNQYLGTFQYYNNISWVKQQYKFQKKIEQYNA
eukprot:Mrub_03852.p1 GENE.Mrub_03852~~Mrub_03852.p1  ORF type:complete len:436 (-),score=48.31 Mrub_03852:67-1230(-)